MTPTTTLPTANISVSFNRGRQVRFRWSNPFNSTGERMIGTRHLLGFWRDEGGTAVVEGAVVIPVLMTLMFGTYEFAWYFYQQQLITTGVHDAARYLARTA